MRNAGKIAAVLSMGMALSAVCGVSAFAADKAFSLDVANWSQQDWNSIAMTNDDTVTSGAIIRSSASTDSDVVGYLYRGAAVNILDKGDTWTQIQSGAVTGYVMNDYLVYGEAAKGLADYYGKEGVVANWNDVNVFTDKSAGSVSRTVSDGTAFPLVSDEGHWLLVQQGADSAGYVSEDDASRMLLVDTAVPADGEDIASTYTENLGGTAAAPTDGTDAAAATSDSSSDNSSAADETGADASSASDAGYSDSSVASDAGDGYSDASASYDSGASDTASASTDTDSAAVGASGSDAASASQETYTSQTVSSNPNVQALYDAYIAAQNAAMNCTSEQDAKDKAAAAVQAYNAYVAAANGTSSASQGQADAQTAQQETSAPAQTEVPQTEAPQTEAPQTEAPQTGSSQSTGSSSGKTGSYADYSDLDLLAAIIWCEAGNQPYDGMVAVGEVVMNRVASSSFPNTIAEVLEQPGQFTPYSSGTLQSALASGVNSTCYQAAQDALNGAQPVPGALYFNTHSGTTKLGAHYFS
ncbi:cell wall hydrolase [Porcincola intestinalis]|uniref:cell wall hydrolase n=1 Tax=Porcincola intestinalis TaxID=2606632 RepID=UPI002A9139EC|nr:cell wall hydrolase [Porcincola intestinalis]MDY5580100.1 cell wall hydrolase [Porcincola intestinalis]